MGVDNGVSITIDDGTQKKQTSFWDDVSSWNWWKTPTGGAKTASPLEIGSNFLGGLSSLVGDWYTANKSAETQKALLQAQLAQNMQLAKTNFANTMSDAAYNRTNHANMVAGWGDQQFTNRTAQNALSSLNSLTDAGANLGISNDALSAQKQQLQSLMG